MNFEIKTKNSFSVPVKRVSKTSSPVHFYYDTKQMELECTFKGWPRPRVVWSNPKNKQIINGSEGFYISEQLVGEDTLTSLLRNPDIQEKQAGAYKCTGMNNITGWSIEKSGIIDLIYGGESFNFLFEFFLHTWMHKTTLKGNSRVTQHFSVKPSKCFSHCNTIKKYIFSDLFGSVIEIQSVKFATYSNFRH